MTTPRVAIVFRGIGDIGGTNNTIADHAREFTRRGYAVDLIGEKVHKGGVTADMGRAVRIRRLPIAKRWRWRWFARQADRLITANNYAFVAGHGHATRQTVLSMHNCLHAAHESITGRPLEPIGSLAEIHDAVFSADRFSVCICNSRLMQADLSQRYGTVIERLPIVYPGYRAEQFNRAQKPDYRDALREKLGAADETLIGLATSGDFKKRGLDLLIEAYARLSPACRARSRLLVMGKPGGSKPFVEQARSAGVADRLHFIGATREPERYFHALDICVHPARFEEFGQTVQEAMACGVPVIASKRVGAMEQLPPAWYDALPETPDVAALVTQLTDLIHSADRRVALADVGHTAVVANTRQANAQATFNLYREAGLPVPPAGHEARVAN